MISNNSALIIVDVQNDFLPGGALAVPQGNEIIMPINEISDKFAHIILTQDWHPSDHFSFAENHKDKRPFDAIDCTHGRQILWPAHCVQGTFGAEFSQNLNIKKAELILRKGWNKTIDSYSAFFENDKKTPTGLQNYCKERGFTDLYFCGLATDFCVGFSALDALKCGFRANIFLKACRAIDKDNSLHNMLSTLKSRGANLE